MKIILTGFNRFGNVERNPSQLVVEEFARRAALKNRTDLVAEVLPTEYAEAGNRIRTLIRQHRPDWVFCLGVAEGISAVHLERVALNMNDAESPDNAGEVHRGRHIFTDGPAAYWSTLPIDAMAQRLADKGIAAAISNHAGTFVCNHVFYSARHEVEISGLTARCGFIHLPRLLLHETEGGHPSRPGMTLPMMIEAVEICLGFVKH